MFFREDASVKEKIYTVAFFIWMFVALYGLITDFETSYGFSLWVFLGSVLFSVVASIPLIKDKHPKNRLHTLSGFGKFKAIGSMYFLLIAFSWAAIGLGLPSLYTGIFGDYVSEKVVVVELDDRRRKGCDHRVRVEGYRSKFCVHPDTFERLVVGSRIRIYGSETRFGFKLKNMRIVFGS